jgi:seryl-tRNA synthetase
MTYDLEVWAPGVERWLEVSSCSTCTDYQARRANLRFRPAPGQRPEFVHTLNGSALALPRVLAALLETHQESDGSVTIPEAVRPYFGSDRIVPPGTP